MSGLTRNQMITATEEIVNVSKTSDNMVVFIPKMDRITEKEIMQDEYDLLGYFVTKHPLDDFKTRINNLDKINTLYEKYGGDSIKIGGIVSKYSPKRTKAGKNMAFLTLEDTTGRVEVIIFSKVYEKYQDILSQNALVEIKGRMEIDEREINGELVRTPKVIASFINTLEEAKEIKEIHLRLTNRDDYQGINDLLVGRSGKVKVFIDYENYLLETNYKIPQTTDLMNKLRNLCLIKEVEV